MAIRAVLFDIGGVLVSTPPTGWQKRWAAHVGLDEREMLRRLRPTWRAGDIGALPLEEVNRRTAAALGLHCDAAAELMEDLWAEYLGTLNKPLADFFTRLRPRYRTGILSNSFVGARERERAAYDFESMCDIVVYSHEEGLKKPEPAFYEIACERLVVEPCEVVFLDDDPANVKAAAVLGMTAVHFRDTEQAITDLEPHLTSGEPLPM